MADKNFLELVNLAKLADSPVFVPVERDAVQTLTNKTLTSPTISSPTITSPTISSPVLSGQGIRQVAVVDLAGAAWHTGNGTADFLSWTAPADIIIERLVVNTTTKSNGAATVDIGTTVVNNHTNGDNLLDAADIGTGIVCIENIRPPTAVDTEKSVVALASGGFITFHALADPTGLVGKAYIFYFTL
jgi:hypothetical protein